MGARARVGIVTGDPGVFQGHPYLYLPQTHTHAQGMGFHGYGYGYPPGQMGQKTCTTGMTFTLESQWLEPEVTEMDLT
jgi:hypothetical protein